MIAILASSSGALLAWAPTVEDLPPAPANSTIRTLDAWDAPPPPPYKWSVTELDWVVPVIGTSIIARQTFMDRLGNSAVAAILLAARADTPTGAALAAWVLRYQIVTDIDVSDPRTIAGVDTMIALGFVLPAARESILARE